MRIARGLALLAVAGLRLGLARGRPDRRGAAAPADHPPGPAPSRTRFAPGDPARERVGSGGAGEPERFGRRPSGRAPEPAVLRVRRPRGGRRPELEAPLRGGAGLLLGRRRAPGDPRRRAPAVQDAAGPDHGVSGPLRRGQRTFTTPRPAADVAGGDLDTVGHLARFAADAGQCGSLRGRRDRQGEGAAALPRPGHRRPRPRAGANPVGFAALGQELRRPASPPWWSRFRRPRSRRRASTAAGADRGGRAAGCCRRGPPRIWRAPSRPPAWCSWTWWWRRWRCRPRSACAEARSPCGSRRATGAPPCGQAPIRLGGSLRWVFGRALACCRWSALAGLLCPVGWPRRDRRDGEAACWRTSSAGSGRGSTPSGWWWTCRGGSPRQVYWLKHAGPRQAPRRPTSRTCARGPGGRCSSRSGPSWWRRASQRGLGGSGRGDLVGQLAMAAAAGLSAADAAERIRARLPDEDWSSFARLSFRDVTRLLKEAAAHHAELGDACRAAAWCWTSRMPCGNGAGGLVGRLAGARGGSRSTGGHPAPGGGGDHPRARGGRGGAAGGGPGDRRTARGGAPGRRPVDHRARRRRGHRGGGDHRRRTSAGRRRDRPARHARCWSSSAWSRAERYLPRAAA